MKLKEIADVIGGSIIGNPDIEITGVAGIKEAGKGSITFIADKKNLQYAFTTNASAIISRESIKGISVSIILADNPYLAFAKTLELFYKPPHILTGISDKSVIGNNVSLGKNISVYPNVYISNKVTIGDRVTVFPFVYIGDNASIGDDSIIYPNVTIRENITIGKNVIIHSGTVIGSDGFGYVQDKGLHYKIPQVGGIIIEDNVEVGANVTIDRATLGNTVIGSGTKIDNLVQIAHNVKIGKNCIILAQVGISGSVEIGDNVVLAGQVGIADHTKIADGVIVIGKSGVTGDLAAGVYSGLPAIPHKQWLRAQSVYAKLPDILRRLQELERKANP